MFDEMNTESDDDGSMRPKRAKPKSAREQRFEAPSWEILRESGNPIYNTAHAYAGVFPDKIPSVVLHHAEVVVEIEMNTLVVTETVDVLCHRVVVEVFTSICRSPRDGSPGSWQVNAVGRNQGMLSGACDSVEWILDSGSTVQRGRGCAIRVLPPDSSGGRERFTGTNDRCLPQVVHAVAKVQAVPSEEKYAGDVCSK
ncbi:hypothetical protein PI125_g10486 [Phytophthora idaei]|nr:hypothetical protein PI125_g10486 [Phytophthora idaei]